MCCKFPTDLYVLIFIPIGLLNFFTEGLGEWFVNSSFASGAALPCIVFNQLCIFIGLGVEFVLAFCYTVAFLETDDTFCSPFLLAESYF